jgi:hypothetical protein
MTKKETPCMESTLKKHLGVVVLLCNLGVLVVMLLSLWFGRTDVTMDKIDDRFSRMESRITESLRTHTGDIKDLQTRTREVENTCTGLTGELRLVSQAQANHVHP